MKKKLLKSMRVLLVAVLLGVGVKGAWAYEVPSGYEIKTVYVGTDNGDGTVTADDFDYESVPAAWVAQSGCVLSIEDVTYVANAEVGSAPEAEPSYVNGKSLCTTVSGTNWDYHYSRYSLADAVSNGFLVFRADMRCSNSPTVIRFLDESGNELLNLRFNNGSNDRYYQYAVNGGSASNCDMHTKYRSYHGFSIEDLVINLNTGAVSFLLDYINTNNSNKREQVTLTKTINFGTGKSIKYLELGSIVNNQQSVHYDNIKFYHVALKGTYYSATFTANGGAFTPTVKIYSDSERTSEVTNGELNNGTTYYYWATQTGYWPEDGEFTVSGANPSISLTMTAKETFTYYLRQKLGSSEATTLQTNTLYEDETITLYYPKYVKSGDDYYVVEANASTPHYGVTLSKTNTTFTATYSLDEDIIYYAEMDDIASGLYDQTQCANYTSNGNARFFQVSKNGKISTSMGIETAGPYDVFVAAIDRGGKSQSLDLYRKTTGGVETLIGEIKSSSNSYLYPNSFNNVSFAVGEELYTQPWPSSSNSGTICIDYVTVSKSKVAYTVEYKCGETTLKTADATRTAVWGTNVTLTDDDKVDVTYDGHLYRYVSDNASSQAIASDGTTVITADFEDLGAIQTITYTLNVGNSAGTTIKSSTSTTDATNISGIDIDQTNAAGEGSGTTSGTGDRTTKLPIKTGANGDTYDTPTNYVLFKYSVAEGKIFTPTSIAIKVANVGNSSANNIKYKATLSDGSNSISGTYVGTKQDGTIEDLTISNEGHVSFTGDVTLKLWAWTIADGDEGKGSAFRMGSPLTIAGYVTYTDGIINAIADCKTYETSAAFATYIDGGSYASAAEVYAAHTAWQVENGTPSKVILNNTVTSADHFWGTLTDGADYDGAPDTKYLANTAGSDYNVNQIVYQLPAGCYKASVWTYSSIPGWRKIYVSKVPASGPWEDLTTPYTSTEGWVELSGEFTLTEPANIAFGLYASAVPERIAGFDNWTLTKVESVSKTITNAGWATYCSPYALDLSGEITNLTDAYIVTGGADGKLIKTSVKGSTVPAGTGLLLKGSPGTVTFPVVASSADVLPNKLVGVTEATVIAERTGYVLMNDETNGLGFYLNSNAFTVGANTAYLPVGFDGESARVTFFSFGDETTGIKSVNGEGFTVNNCYNLSGQRVNQPTKGLYIVNGKKVVIK